MYRVVIIDDDKWALKDIRSSFQFARYGFEITGEYLRAEDALTAILNDPPDLILSDVCMENMSGLELAKRLREKGVSAQIVLLSGYDDFEYVQNAFRYDVFYYMLKPLEDSQVHELMSRICDRLDSADSASHNGAAQEDTFRQALKYIDDHIGVSLPLEQVANALYINKNYLSDLFSKRMGMTFTQYKNALRIRRAKEMIRRGDSNMSRVSQAVGFDSPSRFSKVFRQITGVSPLQYRQSLNIGISAETEDE